MGLSLSLQCSSVPLMPKNSFHRSISRHTAPPAKPLREVVIRDFRAAADLKPRDRRRRGLPWPKSHAPESTPNLVELDVTPPPSSSNITSFLSISSDLYVLFVRLVGSSYLYVMRSSVLSPLYSRLLCETVIDSPFCRIRGYDMFWIIFSYIATYRCHCKCLMQC